MKYDSCVVRAKEFCPRKKKKKRKEKPPHTSCNLSLAAIEENQKTKNYGYRSAQHCIMIMNEPCSHDELISYQQGFKVEECQGVRDKSVELMM